MVIAEDDSPCVEMVHCAEYAVEECVLRHGSAIDRAVGDDIVTEN